MLITEKNLKQLTDFVLKNSKASETEVLVFVDNSSLTRFANNQIHQNVSSENLSVQVRCIVGKKQGVASTNLNLSVASFSLNTATKLKLKEVTQQAYDIAKISPEDPHFVHLPGFAEGKFTYPKVTAFDEKTALTSPEERSKEVEKIIKLAKEKKITAFGSLSSSVGEIVVANSHGVFAYFPLTQGYLNIRVMGEISSGYAGETNMDFSKLNIELAAKRAIKKTLLGQKQTAVEPGDYEVILEEPAVAEMMTYMSYLGFGGRAYHEERSFMSGNLGKKVMGENVTILDKGLNPEVLPMPFDYQGIPKSEVTLIEKGIAKNIVYDHYLSTRYKTTPTGHGFPAPHTEDAYAFHLHLQPGGTPKSKLLKGVKKGILVSRFWYVRNVHPKELSITGMTRDGTFLIKNGEIVSGVNNMRFTVSIPKVFSNIVELSKEVHLEPSDEGFGASLLPAMRVKDFTFTGVSKL